MKNVMIIHGYNGIPKVHKWLKQELELRGYKVIMPEFPPREGVIYDKWSKLLDIYKDNFNQETIVVAHSIGNEFIVKYLTKNNIKIKGYVSLAGFGEYFEWEGKEDLARATKEFLVNEEEIFKFINSTIYRYSIYSDDDHIVPFNILETYPKLIEAKPVLIRGIGHMGSKSGIERISELLEIVENIE